MSLARYESYRDSGVEWLGEVPRHWDVRRIGTLYTEANEPGSDELPILSVSIHSGVSDGEMSEEEAGRKFSRSEDRSKYKRVEPSDLVYNMMRAWQGAFGAVRVHGAVSPAYVVARPCGHDASMFFEHVLRTSNATEEVRRHSAGVADFRLRLYWESFKNIRVPWPPVEERAAICHFLEGETTKLDTLAEQQKLLVALLREKRHALISRVVAKGLDDGVPMKPSGLSPFDDVPQHWRVTPIKNVARLESGHTPSRLHPEYWIEEECTIPWFTLADVGVLRDGVVTHVADTVHKISALGMANSAARLLPKNTVFLSRTASVGFSGVMATDMAVSQDFAAWVCGDDLLPEYLLLCLRSMTGEFRRLMMGSTHQTIYMPDIERLRIPLPPKSEQAEIVRFCFEQKAKLEKLMAETATAIKLMEERGTALNFAAVTGKIDVRGTTAVHAPDPREATCAEIVRLCARKPNFGRVKMQKLVYLAEAHLGIHEIGGDYAREAAGPLDRSLVQAVERSLQDRGIVEVNQDGRGSQVTYTFVGRTKEIKERADNVLGARCPALRDLVKKIGDLDTLSVEAIATLYAVWNDALIDGETPDEAEIIRRVLEEWHPEKAEKFNSEALSGWLTYMRRNSIVPQGRGPHTHTPRLFP